MWRIHFCQPSRLLLKTRLTQAERKITSEISRYSSRFLKCVRRIVPLDTLHKFGHLIKAIITYYQLPNHKSWKMDVQTLSAQVPPLQAL